MANAEPSTVLDRQAHKAAPCSAEAEVDSPNNGKLGLYPDPRHDHRVRPIPLCGKAACQAFLVRGVLPMEDGICGTDQWCKRAAHVLAGARVLPLLCFCCLPGDGIPHCTHLLILSRTFLGVCTHPYTGARVSSTYARTHVPTTRRFLSKPSAAFYI